MLSAQIHVLPDFIRTRGFGPGGSGKVTTMAIISGINEASQLLLVQSSTANEVKTYFRCINFYQGKSSHPVLCNYFFLLSFLE